MVRSVMDKKPILHQYMCKMGFMNNLLFNSSEPQFGNSSVDEHKQGKSVEPACLHKCVRS